MKTFTPKKYRAGIQFPPTVAGGGFVETVAEHRTHHAPIAHLASIVTRALVAVGVPQADITPVIDQMHLAARRGRFGLGGQFLFTVAPNVLGVQGLGARAWLFPVDHDCTYPT